MGRVTIFAIDDCPFCQKAKGILKDHGVEYYEINLNDYPQKRSDMLKAAKILTVPQIFFNDKHIGGASELEALKKEGGLAQLLEETLAGEDPKNPLLERPNEPPAVRPKPSPRALEEISLGEKSLGVIEAVMQMEKSLGKAFKASALVSMLQKEYGVSDEQAAIDAGQQILEFGLISGANAKSSFKGDGATFTLKNAENPSCLNNFRDWKDRVDEPMLLISNLKKQLGNVVGKHRDKEGMVDYVAVSTDPDFYAFDEASCELQGIDLLKMDAKTKLAFVINVYNTGIIHAFAKVGAPRTGLQRAKFFPVVGYNIGGQFFSFDLLESGILRGNRPGPGLHRTGPIPANDPRLKTIMKPDEVDNRIHFALNCGAKSCPPVKKFTAEAVDEELDIVARAFLMQEENFSVSGNTVHLSKILSWYGKDFGSNKMEVVATVSQWLTEDKAAKVKELVDSKSLKVSFNTYDWSNDSKRSKQVASACTIM